jgi:threonyl-tRNA synthetase
MKISVKDGPSGDIRSGMTVGGALSDLGVVDRDILAAKVDGAVVDLSCPLTESSTLELLRFDSAEGREVYRHSSTHLMAQAVKELFPSAQLTIGPALEDSFYYDFAFERPFTPEDLQRIEERAAEIIKRNLAITRREFSKQDAIDFFRARGEQYKVELIQGFPD